jgi:hypothetical protein
MCTYINTFLILCTVREKEREKEREREREGGRKKVNMIVVVGLSDGTEAGEEKRMTQMTGGKKCEGNTE